MTLDMIQNPKSFLTTVFSKPHLFLLKKGELKT